MINSFNIVPIALLLSSFFLAFVVDKKYRKIYIITSIIRLLLITIAIMILKDARIFNMYPDQKFYISTAESISRNIQVDGLFIDYKNLVGLHNRSYNVVGGILLFLNNGHNSVLVFRSLNFLLHSLIIVLSLNLLQSFTKAHKNTFFLLILLGLLPSFLVYSILTLRELLLSLALLLFIYGFINKDIKLFLLSLVLSYFTRMQLIIVYGTAIVLLYLFTYIKKLCIKPAYKILLVFFGLFLSIILFNSLFPNYSYLSNHLQIGSLVRFSKEFVIGLFGVSFFFHRNTTELQPIMIFLTKFLTPEVFIIPGLYIYYLFKTKFSVKSSMLLNIMLILYSFGYFVEFSLISNRYILIFYPIMLIHIFSLDFSSIPLVTKIFDGIIYFKEWFFAKKMS